MSQIAQAPTMKSFEAIILIETGDPTPEEYAAAFQSLIDSGIVWTLQGWYGRTAMDLARAGYVTLTTNP